MNITSFSQFLNLNKAFKNDKSPNLSPPQSTLGSNNSCNNNLSLSSNLSKIKHQSNQAKCKNKPQNINPSSESSIKNNPQLRILNELNNCSNPSIFSSSLNSNDKINDYHARNFPGKKIFDDSYYISNKNNSTFSRSTMKTSSFHSYKRFSRY